MYIEGCLTVIWVSIGMRKLYEVTDIAEIIAWLHELIAGIKVAKVGAADGKADRKNSGSKAPAAASDDDDSDSDSNDSDCSDSESDDEDAQLQGSHADDLKRTIAAETTPLPEGAERTSGTFGEHIIEGLFLEQKGFLGDALTRKLATAHIHENHSEECITSTKMAVHALCGDFHAQMHLGGLTLKTLDRGKGHGSAGTYQNLKEGHRTH